MFSKQTMVAILLTRSFALSAAVRTWGLGAAILLIFVAMFLISNTIRITILSRQREIQIMRLVGAKMVTFAGLSS